MEHYLGLVLTFMSLEPSLHLCTDSTQIGLVLQLRIYLESIVIPFGHRIFYPVIVRYIAVPGHQHVGIVELTIVRKILIYARDLETALVVDLDHFVHRVLIAKDRRGQGLTDNRRVGFLQRPSTALEQAQGENRQKIGLD